MSLRANYYNKAWSCEGNKEAKWGLLVLEPGGHLTDGPRRGRKRSEYMGSAFTRDTMVGRDAVSQVEMSVQGLSTLLMQLKMVATRMRVGAGRRQAKVRPGFGDVDECLCDGGERIVPRRATSIEQSNEVVVEVMQISQSGGNEAATQVDVLGVDTVGRKRHLG